MASRPVAILALVTALLLWSTAGHLPVMSRKRSDVKGSYIATKHTMPRAYLHLLSLLAGKWGRLKRGVFRLNRDPLRLDRDALRRPVCSANMGPNMGAPGVD